MNNEKKMTKKQLVNELLKWERPKEMVRALTRTQDRFMQTCTVVTENEKSDFELLTVLREFLEDLDDMEEDKRIKRQWDA